MSEKVWSLTVVKAKRETYENELLYGGGAKMKNAAMGGEVLRSGSSVDQRWRWQHGAESEGFFESESERVCLLVMRAFFFNIYTKA